MRMKSHIIVSVLTCSLKVIGGQEKGHIGRLIAGEQIHQLVCLLATLVAKMCLTKVIVLSLTLSMNL